MSDRNEVSRHPLRAAARGFTLIEIMVVVIIIGLLAAVIVPTVIGKVDEARVVKAKQDIQALETALQMFRLQNSKYPTSEQGLQALVTQPTDPDHQALAAGRLSANGSARTHGATTISTSTRARTARNTTCSPMEPTAPPVVRASMPTSATGTSATSAALGRRRARGFTLIEILVVVAIIAVVSVGVILLGQPHRARSRPGEGERPLPRAVQLRARAGRAADARVRRAVR